MFFSQVVSVSFGECGVPSLFSPHLFQRTINRLNTEIRKKATKQRETKMYRHAVNPGQLRVWAANENDNFYPLSNSVIEAWRERKTLYLQFAENLQTPFNVIRKLYFPNAHHSLLRSAGDGESQNAPRFFNQEQQMELLTGNDARYAMKINNVVLTGFSFDVQHSVLKV